VSRKCGHSGLHAAERIPHHAGMRAIENLWGCFVAMAPALSEIKGSHNCARTCTITGQGIASCPAAGVWSRKLPNPLCRPTRPRPQATPNACFHSTVIRFTTISTHYVLNSRNTPAEQSSHTIRVSVNSHPLPHQRANGHHTPPPPRSAIIPARRPSAPAHVIGRSRRASQCAVPTNS
jgi:hypothetical protein